VEAHLPGNHAKLREASQAPSQPSEFSRRIARSMLRDLPRAIKEACDALQAGRRWSEAEAQDAVAEQILRTVAYLLPDSARMQRAARDGLNSRGRSTLDDEAALTEIAALTLRGEQLMPACRKAARLAANPARVTDENVAQRLRRKFRKEPEWYFRLALKRLEREAIQAAEAELARRQPPHLRPEIASWNFRQKIRRTFVEEADIKVAQLIERLGTK
jgi:hypothetical protein